MDPKVSLLWGGGVSDFLGCWIFFFWPVASGKLIRTVRVIEVPTAGAPTLCESLCYMCYIHVLYGDHMTKRLFYPHFIFFYLFWSHPQHEDNPG